MSMLMALMSSSMFGQCTPYPLPIIETLISSAVRGRGAPILLDFVAGAVAESADFVVKMSDGLVFVFGAEHLVEAAIIPETVDHEGERGCPPMTKPKGQFGSP